MVRGNWPKTKKQEGVRSEPSSTDSKSSTLEITCIPLGFPYQMPNSGKPFSGTLASKSHDISVNWLYFSVLVLFEAFLVFLFLSLLSHTSFNLSTSPRALIPEYIVCWSTSVIWVALCYTNLKREPSDWTSCLSSCPSMSSFSNSSLSSILM